MKTAYKFRSVLIFLFFCSLYLIILFNLYALQIRQHQFYTHLAQQQHHVTITSMPPRALIYDRKGTVLALNKDATSAFILPTQLTSPATLEPFLKEHFPESFQRLQENKPQPFMFIQRKLSQQQLDVLKNAALPDIHFLKEPNRYYTLPSAGPLLGITNIDNKGLFGLELQYDEQLAGKPSTYQLEKDARSHTFYFKR